MHEICEIQLAQCHLVRVGELEFRPRGISLHIPQCSRGGNTLTVRYAVSVLSLPLLPTLLSVVVIPTHCMWNRDRVSLLVMGPLRYAPSIA